MNIPVCIANYQPGRPAVHGYTLAELAVVIVIIAMILTVALPRFSGISESEKLKTAVRRLSGMALESYSQAASKSKPWYFCLDLDKNRAWLSSEPVEDEKEGVKEPDDYRLPEGVKIEDVVHPEKGMVKEGWISFGYWPQGGSEPGTVHLSTEGGEKMTIFLRPFLGRTESAEGYLREEPSS